MARAHACTTQSSPEYQVLLIFTDGVFGSEQVVVDQLVAAASLPLTVVVCGMGDVDFAGMNILFGPGALCVDSQQRVRPPLAFSLTPILLS